MRTPLARIRWGFLWLVVVLVASVIGYRLLGYTWIGSVWMVVITIATVGYGESSNQPEIVQLFTILVILLGISASAYTLGGFLQLWLAGEVDRALGRERMEREIHKIEKHTIICGFGRIGQILAADLSRQKQAFLVIDTNAERCAEADDKGFLHLHGDATNDDVLLEAGVRRARTLITGLPNDAANVFITLTSRNLNPNLQIIARAEHATTERKLRQAGANRIVMPATIGAQQMARMITRPTTADLMELVAEQGTAVEIDELRIKSECKLAEQTLRESEIHRQFGLLVLAVKRASGGMVLSPEADYRFAVNDIVILMGKPESITHFRNEYNL
jgi:voltage-gated potassium channel